MTGCPSADSSSSFKTRTMSILEPLIRVLSVACLLALAVLSWLPGDEIVRTAIGGHVEHVIAYAGTAATMGLAWRRHMRLDVQCALLIGYAAVLEAGQLYVQGRQASIGDFAFSAMGVVIGGVFSWLVRSRPA